MQSLNNNKNTAPLTLDQVLVGQWHGLFQFSQNSNTPTHLLFNTRQCVWTHLVFRPARSWAQMHLLFKQRGAGRENDNCVGLKLAKNTCVTPHCTGVWLVPMSFSFMHRLIVSLHKTSLYRQKPQVFILCSLICLFDSQKQAAVDLHFMYHQGLQFELKSCLPAFCCRKKSSHWRTEWPEDE